MENNTIEINEKINMKGKEFITFDPYYGVEEYNSFLTAAKNNNIEYEEFIKIKPPFQRFIMVEPKELPKFLNYDKATSADINWLISLVKPVQPNEAYYLKRRPGQDISYFKYILPKPFEKMHEKSYVCVFKGWDMTELQNWTRTLGKGTKIYKWGKAEIKGYGIFVCFNPYIKGLIPSSRILLEYDNSGVNTSKKVPNKPGYIEYELNHFVLVQEKLFNKTWFLEYYEDGKKVPLKKTSFI